MSAFELESQIKELRELETLAAELNSEIEMHKDLIKTEMNNRGVDELTVGAFIVRWTEILSNRFDSTAFKKVMPDVYKAYTKQITSRRFTISE